MAAPMAAAIPAKTPALFPTLFADSSSIPEFFATVVVILETQTPITIITPIIMIMKTKPDELLELYEVLEFDV